MKNKQKLTYVISVVVIGVILIILIPFWFLKNKNTPSTSEAPTEEVVVKKKRISAPQNVIPLAERPVVSLRPFDCASNGQCVSIEVSQIRTTATAAEYEIVYSVAAGGVTATSASGGRIKVPEAEAEGGLQGFTGELDINNLPTKTENRFGTCSAGGACINHAVADGTLTLNFDATEKYGVTSNWTYFSDGKADSVTADKAFTISAPILGKAGNYLIMEMMGLPDGLSNEVATIADGGKDNGTKPVAYQIRFTTAPTMTTAAVTFAAQKDGQAIAVYDGKAWSIATDAQAAPLGDGYIYALVTE